MRLPFLALGFILSAVVFIGASIVIAWSGPTQPPPNGNVSAPINVGTTDQIKDAGLGLNALAVFGNSILSGPSITYLNFGDSAGKSGYGLRDNAGTMEFKNSGGTWSSFLPSTNVQSITFADGTTQTTAQTGGDSGTLCGVASASETGTSVNCSSASYSSIATCKGASITSSCPAGYSQRSLTVSSQSSTGSGGVGPITFSIRCLRTCVKI